MTAAEVSSPPKSALEASAHRAVPVVINDGIRIPAEVVDLDSFCRWVSSEQRPEHGRFSYLAGEIWVDLGSNQFYTYSPVNAEITQVLYSLVKAARTGRFLGDGIQLLNRAADLSAEPDGVFVTYEALRERRAVCVERWGRLILEGSPELVLEIVSDTSVAKDTVRLREIYWKAGIREYWLIDVRGGKIRFDLLKRGPKAFTATRRQAGGWLESRVFGKSFRLIRQSDPLGDPQFILEMRD